MMGKLLASEICFAPNAEVTLLRAALSFAMLFQTNDAHVD